MAPMFETPSFQESLTSVISNEAAASGLTQYEQSVVRFLQHLATANEPELNAIELRKVASARRGVPEALSSARELARLAATYAANDGRKVLSLSDMETAYRAKFCQVWPFCK